MTDKEDEARSDPISGGEGEPPRERELRLNMGPAHPAMHGIIQIKLQLAGETVTNADVEIGYLHRAFEKHCENVPYTQCFPYTDRLNYVSPFINNVGFALAVEKLFGIETPPRCRYIRVLMSEISRVADHLTCIGASAMELGAFSAFLYMMKAREYLYELLEDFCGARITVSAVRVGGLKADLPAGFDEKAKKAFREVRGVLREIDLLLTKNRIFVDRLKGTGIISKEEAVSYGITGPILRACGVPYDVRRTDPYLVYDELDFEIPTGEGGDNYDRYLVRMAEMEQSMRIAEQCLEKMPGGAVMVDPGGRTVEPAFLVDEAKRGRTEGVLSIALENSPNLEGSEKRYAGGINADEEGITLPPKEETYSSIEGMMRHFKLVMSGHGIRPPSGEVYQAVEGGNGELGFYIVSDGSDRPYRVKCRPPCFFPMAALHRMIEGGMVSDIIATFGSINMIGGELDR